MRNMEKRNYPLTSETIEHLPMETLVYMLDAVKERLADLRSQESKTTDRAYLVLSFYSTLLVAQCAWFYTHISLTPGCMALAVLLAGTILSAIIMYQVIKPRDYIPLGRDLMELHPNRYASYFKEKAFDSYQARKSYIQSELSAINQGALLQEAFNTKRVTLFDRSLKAFLAGIVLSLLTLILSSLLWALLCQA